jgi:hypothetical protein
VRWDRGPAFPSPQSVPEEPSRLKGKRELSRPDSCRLQRYWRIAGAKSDGCTLHVSVPACCHLARLQDRHTTASGNRHRGVYHTSVGHLPHSHRSRALGPRIGLGLAWAIVGVDHPHPHLLCRLRRHVQIAGNPLIVQIPAWVWEATTTLRFLDFATCL